MLRAGLAGRGKPAPVENCRRSGATCLHPALRSAMVGHLGRVKTNRVLLTRQTRSASLRNLHLSLRQDSLSKNKRGPFDGFATNRNRSVLRGWRVE